MTSLGEFLVCSEHQRTILALWIVHTYCFEAFPCTPYLNIYSPEKQSGKTVCLQVLRYLASDTWMPGGGLTATRLMERIAQRRPTLLLDDWQTAFRPTETQAIIGFLIASCTRNSKYAVRGASSAREDKDVHCPKAFAGSATLPAPLAERSIPIVLQRRKRSEGAMPMWQVTIIERAKPLVEQIRRWIEDFNVFYALVNHGCDAAVVHSRFSFRQRELTVPLLAIADTLGGKWPRKARLALYRAFDIYAGDDLSTGVQLLEDIRDFFARENHPGKIFTTDLLKHLHELKDRPWGRYHSGKALDPNGLRKFLRDFGMPCSSSQRTGKSTRKGLLLQHFTDLWERYLPVTTPAVLSEPVAATQEVGIQASEVGTSMSEVGTNAQEVGTILPEVGTKTAEVGTYWEGDCAIPNVCNESLRE